MTTEQIAILLGGVVAILTASGYFIRSIAKARLLDADAKARARIIQSEIDKTESETDSALIKSQTETLSEFRAELRVVRTEKRKAEEERDEYKINWQNTLTMLEARNEEKNTLQADRDEWKRKAENLQAKLDYCIDKDPSMGHLLDDKDK